MITTPMAAKTIIQRSRYLSEALSKNLINYSALARYIKPELENLLGKKVSSASVLMAIQRISKDFKPKYSSENIFETIPSLIMRSNLFLITYNGNISADLMKNAGDFMILTHGVNETTLVASVNSQKSIEQKLENRLISKRFKGLCAITIELPKKAIDSPSVYYFFLKSLAWEGINIVQIFTTTKEMTLIVAETDLKNTLGIIQSLFNRIED